MENIQIQAPTTIHLQTGQRQVKNVGINIRGYSMVWIVEKMMDFVISDLGDDFIGSIKVKRKMLQISEVIKNDFLSKYGNQLYYNNLDINSYIRSEELRILP